MAASGYPNFIVSSWFGVLAPAGTPANIIEKLNASVASSLQKPALRKRLEELGAAPQTLSSQDYGEFIKAQVDSWGTVIKTAGVTTGT
jgi:tripartite-type tricarboxylate transporter receptor subunit TctC